MYAENQEITELKDHIRERVEQAIDPYALIPYEELAPYMGGALNHSRLTNVREKLQRDHNMLFATVRGEGIRLMPDEERARAGVPHLYSIRRHCRKAVKKTNTVEDVNELSDDAFWMRGAVRSLMFFIEDATRTRTVKKVADAVVNRRQQAPVVEDPDGVDAVLKFYQGEDSGSG